MAYSGATCILHRHKITNPILGPNHRRHHIGPPSSRSRSPIPHWTNWRCGLSAPPNNSRNCSKNTRCRATSSIDFHPNHHDHVPGAAGSTLMVGSPGPQCHRSKVVGSPPLAPTSFQSSGLGLLGLAAAWVGASKVRASLAKKKNMW